MTAPPGPGSGKGVFIGLLVVAALILLSLFTYSWFAMKSGGEGDEGLKIGILGVEMCRDSGRCESKSWGELGEDDDVGQEINIFAKVSLIGGIAAAVLAAIAGFLGLSGKPARVPGARIAAGVAAGGSAAFLFRILGDKQLSDEVSISWSALLNLGALIASAIMIGIAAKASSTVAVAAVPAPGGGYPPGQWGQQPPHGQPPQYPQQPMAQQPYPQQPQQPPPQPPPQQTFPCRTCQRPLVFVAQYQRWYCEGCRQYV